MTRLKALILLDYDQLNITSERLITYMFDWFDADELEEFLEHINDEEC